MHFEDQGFKTFPSAYDFTQSGTVLQPNYLIVKVNSSGQITPATAATDKFIGVNFDLPKVGMPGQVRLSTASGTSNVQVGGTVNPGDYLTSNASGQAITTTTSGNNILGQALEAGVNGQIIEYLPVSPAVHY